MAVRFFGQFLVERGVVTSEKLLSAIELQEQRNLKLGEMAVNMGFITHDDIERSHNAQYSNDMKLGDLLVQMELLTPAQLSEVIEKQKENRLYIGEALVQVNALSAEELELQLAAFREDQAQYVSDRIELPAGIKNRAVWEIAADLTYKMLTRIIGLNFRPEKSIVVTSFTAGNIVAGIDFNGDVSARYILSASKKVKESIAKAILREENVESEPAEVIEDSVMEFVNVVCGNIAAKASQSGVVLDILPPVIIRQKEEQPITVPDGRIGVSFPIHVADGEKIEIILLIRQ